MSIWNNIRRIDSVNESVSKFVFENESSVAESVLYKYPTYSDRTVICCSTQSGCPVGCRFCGAGDNFVRSLTADEIVQQPVHLLEQTGVDVSDIKRLQIMFMSMGEPLLNLGSLGPALFQLYGLYPNASLLISSIAPRLNYDVVHRTSQLIPTIGLQFSIHESTDEARNRLIPFKAKLTLQEIANEGVIWADVTGRRPFFNYCVHDKNNTQGDVDRLNRLFDPFIWNATISVICERDETIAAANSRQRQLASDFMGRMVNVGYDTRMFDPAGQDDIGGGCGQLWFVQQWMQDNPQLSRPSVGHGLVKVHTPV
jgi:23S rRNA (adenine2503-C2)-methyltransferase